jgi:hypothetical protein
MVGLGEGNQYSDQVTGWMNEELCFDSQQEKYFFIFENVQTISIVKGLGWRSG